MDKQKVISMGRYYRWIVIADQRDIGMISFVKTFILQQQPMKRINLDLLINGPIEIKTTIRINVYLTTGTVGTCLNHPKKGKTQLFRRNISYYQLEKIFQNPRIHTGKGYYVKK